MTTTRGTRSPGPPAPPPAAPKLKRAAALAAILLMAACGRGERRSDHTAAAAAPDSTVFGDDRAHSGAARAPDVALLERLIDEYEALDVVMDGLASPGSESPVKGHAWKGDRHEDATKERLSDLLTAEFHERYQPRTPSGARASVDTVATLARRPGKAALDSIVVAQHHRVADAIAAGTASLTNVRVREALTKLESDVREEIARLER